METKIGKLPNETTKREETKKTKRGEAKEAYEAKVEESTQEFDGMNTIIERYIATHIDDCGKQYNEPKGKLE